jgi:hypothetical protein
MPLLKGTLATREYATPPTIQMGNATLTAANNFTMMLEAMICV